MSSFQRKQQNAMPKLQSVFIGSDGKQKRQLHEFVVKNKPIDWAEEEEEEEAEEEEEGAKEGAEAEGKEARHPIS